MAEFNARSTVTLAVLGAAGAIRAIAPQVATHDKGLSWLLGALERSAKAAIK